MAVGPWGTAENVRFEVAPVDPRRRERLDESQRACEQCGAVLAFAPGTNELECRYCGHTNQIQIAPIEIVERNLTAELQGQGERAATEEIESVECSSCDAVFTFDANIHAGDCPFCGQSIVTGTGAHNRIKPAAILPFAIEETAARESVSRWLKGLWFAPSSLKRMGRVGGALHGIYLPYWTFDSDTITTYWGQRGDIYFEPQEVSVVVDGRRTTQTRMVQKIRWRPVRGRVSRFFDDVVVLASKSLPTWMTDQLEPWDMRGLKPYSALYVTGFQSESYQVALDDGFGVAQERIKARIAADVRMDIGGDLQRVERMDIDHGRPTFKHILLPLWLGAFRYNGRGYNVCVNGQSGEVQGERPYSAWKIALAVILAVILFGGAAWLYLNAQGLAPVQVY